MQGAGKDERQTDEPVTRAERMRENLTQTRAPNPFETGAAGIVSFRYHVERTKRAIHRAIAAPPLFARWQEEVEGSILNDSKPELT